MKGRSDASYLQPRIPAIGVPCPCSVSPRLASLVSTSGLSVLYLLWSLGLWWGYFGVGELKAFVKPSSAACVELRNMATFALFSAWYFATWTLLSFVAFVISIFPQKDVAKHLSRLLWFSWMVTWFVGIYGIAAHLSADAWMQAGCDRGEACEMFRQRLQIWIIVALFVTLALVFWIAIVFSAFVHTLHPRIFHTGDIDSDLDEYDHACLLEAELRYSNHPLAAEALELLQAERESGGRLIEKEGIRSRRVYLTRSEGPGSELESEDEEDRTSLMRGHSDSGERVPSATTRGRSTSMPIDPPLQHQSDSEDSSEFLSDAEKSDGAGKRGNEGKPLRSESLSRSRSRSRGRSASVSRASRG